MEKSRFELLSTKDIQSLEEELTAIRNASGMSQTTIAIIQSAVFGARGLFYDARAVLIDAVKRDPDETTLHFLLADVYEKTGLKDLAAEEYGESDFLLKAQPPN